LVWQNAKNPTAVRQWGSEISVSPLEPDCHAAQEQRARRQSQVEAAIHAPTVSAFRSGSQSVFSCSRQLASAKVALQKKLQAL